MASEGYKHTYQVPLTLKVAQGLGRGSGATCSWSKVWEGCPSGPEPEECNIRCLKLAPLVHVKSGLLAPNPTPLLMAYIRSGTRCLGIKG